MVGKPSTASYTVWRASRLRASLLGSSSLGICRTPVIAFLALPWGAGPWSPSALPRRQGVCTSHAAAHPRRSIAVRNRHELVLRAHADSESCTLPNPQPRTPVHAVVHDFVQTGPLPFSASTTRSVSATFYPLAKRTTSACGRSAASWLRPNPQHELRTQSHQQARWPLACIASWYSNTRGCPPQVAQRLPGGSRAPLAR